MESINYLGLLGKHQKRELKRVINYSQNTNNIIINMYFSVYRMSDNQSGMFEEMRKLEGENDDGKERPD